MAGPARGQHRQQEREDQPRADPGGARARRSRIRVAGPCKHRGARNHPGEMIEWARGARRSPCTRRAADQERPRQRIDQGRSDQADRRTGGRADQPRAGPTVEQIVTGRATRSSHRPCRSQREPFSQLQALTDRQKERPERRSLGESIPAVPTAFRRDLAANVGTAGIHRLSRSHDCGRANKDSQRPLQDLPAGLNPP